MAWILDILFFAFRGLLYRQTAKRAKAQGVLIYLKTLQIARVSVMALLALFALLQVIIFGLIGAMITGVWLLPQDAVTKLWILFGTFTFLFIVPLVILIFAFSEKIWYHLSGAEKLVEKNVG